MVTFARIYLDDNATEDNSAIRCGFVVAHETSGRERVFADIIDSAEYHCLRDLVRDVAGALNISRQQVLVN